MCKVVALLALLSLPLYPCALRGQTTNGSITGRVTDVEGRHPRGEGRGDQRGDEFPV